MHIDQRLEAVLLAAVVQPVDGAFLVDFYMVGVEAVQEIIADDGAGAGALNAKCLGDESKVIFQGIGTVHDFYKLHKAANNIIGEVFFVGDGQHVVCVRDKGCIFAVIPLTASIGKAVHIQRVAAKHTANRIRKQAFDLPCQVSAAHGNVLILHFGGQFILQAVNINKDTVQLFLVSFELVKALVALCFPGGEFI